MPGGAGTRTAGVQGLLRMRDGRVLVGACGGRLQGGIGWGVSLTTSGTGWGEDCDHHGDSLEWRP